MVDLFTLGLDRRSGAPLRTAVSSEDFCAAWASSVRARRAAFKAILRRASAVRDGAASVTAADLSNPRVVGWRFVVAERDPDRDALVKALAPLAKVRGGEEPVTLPDVPESRWDAWIESIPRSPVTRRRPGYLLLVGNPPAIPFELQILLQGTARVGRLAYDRVDDVAAYVDKVLRHETADVPVAQARCAVLATDHGPDDATHWSRTLLVEPLLARVPVETGAEVVSRVGEAATRDALKDLLRDTRAAVAFIASHGVVASGEPLATQRAVNGAIVCQPEAQRSLADGCLHASDLTDEPALEGGVLFQFGCAGYGTPSVENAARWFGLTDTSAGDEFVAALPKRLLAHPRGPLAYVGHLDVAHVSAFVAPGESREDSTRVRVFLDAITRVLSEEPVGCALASLQEVASRLLAYLFNLALDEGSAPSPEEVRATADVLMRFADARHHMILGDPAARVRVRRP